MVDITEQKGLEAQLSHQAFHDALTGLPNRAYFTEQVTAAIARARRSGQGMVVVYLDLDDFKIVNDTFGHGVGDRLLVEVARRLRATIRASDLAARVGGDEFNLLLEGFNDEIAADDMVRRLLVVLSEPYQFENDDVRIRATAGIAGLGGADYTVVDLQRNADAALYEAKAEGKSRQAWFDPAMGARASARVEIENGLRRALELGEIEVAYQPVVDLRTGVITGVEALARWRHPERGAVPPSEFIPVAERVGLIVELGRFVLREACLASVRLAAAAGDHPVPVSVNVSARQIVDADFVADVRSALEAAGLAAEHLTLELTESILILDSDRTDEVVAALKALGVRLAIDDFGTGHSSLSYARRFPVDELKIDRSFIDGLGRSREDAAIVTAAIAFARALHLDCHRRRGRDPGPGHPPPGARLRPCTGLSIRPADGRGRTRGDPARGRPGRPERPGPATPGRLTRAERRSDQPTAVRYRALDGRDDAFHPTPAVRRCRSLADRGDRDGSRDDGEPRRPTPGRRAPGHPRAAAARDGRGPPVVLRRRARAGGPHGRHDLPVVRRYRRRTAERGGLGDPAPVPGPRPRDAGPAAAHRAGHRRWPVGRHPRLPGRHERPVERDLPQGRFPEHRRGGRRVRRAGAPVQPLGPRGGVTDRAAMVTLREVVSSPVENGGCQLWRLLSHSATMRQHTTAMRRCLCPTLAEQGRWCI